jgi:hypothetical protein
MLKEVISVVFVDRRIGSRCSANFLTKRNHAKIGFIPPAQDRQD